MIPTIPAPRQSAEPGIADDAFADVPEIMKQARRWLVWRAERHGTGKPRKVPHYADGARRGGADTETDRARLVTFDPYHSTQFIMHASSASAQPL